MKPRTLNAYVMSAVEYARANPQVHPYTVACLILARKPSEVLPQKVPKMEVKAIE